MQQPTHIRHRIGYRLLVACAMLALIFIGNASAQTTAFTYQGRLNDNGNPASGNYDFQFTLFDTATVGTGTQLGNTATVPTVQVTAGIFTVQLDFGVSVFPGAARFLEIAVKQTSGSSFTTLGPRQPVTSNPYAIRSLAAAAADGLSVACVGCITSSQIQTVQGSQVTGNIAGSQISGTIPVASVPPGSENYVQNTNTSQASVNFNIGGTGTANILNATTQFNLGGSRVLSQPGAGNLFVGIGTGTNNTTGIQNSFFGINAGQANTAGGGQSFFGAGAGQLNTAFCCNSFFGNQAGASNTSGLLNSFYGSRAGQANTTGNGNSFFGAAGGNNTTGAFNSFVGLAAGSGNTTGNSNSFFGDSTGQNSTTGQNNTFIGDSADFTTTGSTGDNNTLIGASAKTVSGLSNSTAIGYRAQITQSNSLVLGAINGTNGATSDTNVGIGTTAPSNRLVVDVGASTASDPGITIQGKTSAFGDIGMRIRNTGTGGVEWYIDSTDNNSNYGGSKLAFTPRGDITPTLTLNSTGNVGIGTTAPRGRLEAVGDWDGSFGAATVTGDRPTIRFSGGSPAANQQWILHLGSAVGSIPAGSLSFFNGGTGGTFSSPAMALTPTGTIAVTNLGSAGSATLCRNASNEISTCSSSLRYKTNLAAYRNGLDVISRLQPITFTWKEVGGRDIGLAAEEVEKIEPLLIFRNSKGEIEGVKYDRITVALVNAVREQQAQIERQRHRLKQQQQEIEALEKRQQEFVALKGLVCADHPGAEMCKSKYRR